MVAVVGAVVFKVVVLAIDGVVNLMRRGRDGLLRKCEYLKNAEVGILPH
jgi:hypothetical protein